jgi:hypothetical protein
MASLFLGKIKVNNKSCELHAFTNDIPFREYSISEVGDKELFFKLLSKRYEILNNGQPIFCTAINPDHERKIESNPHDFRDGTIHIASISTDGEIIGGLSLAVDTGAFDDGNCIGLPLENNWKRNGYPQGASLDEFRKKYYKTVYKIDKEIEPWEMVELYRHFNSSHSKSDIIFRLGLYTGGYNLLIRKPKINKIKQTNLWVFDAIPQYFNLYRYAGAVLRDSTINQNRILSPNLKDSKDYRKDGSNTIIFNGDKISRELLTLIPKKNNGQFDFTHQGIAFIDGLVDGYKLDEIIDNPTKTFLSFKHKGISFKELIAIRASIGLIINRKKDFKYFLNNPISQFFEKKAYKKYKIQQYDFVI